MVRERARGKTLKLLEQSLAKNPDDELVRYQLLIKCYESSLGKKLSPGLFEHLSWFIRNNPRMCELDCMMVLPESDWNFIPELKKLWLEAMKKARDEGNNYLLVDYNAAMMLQLYDPEWSREILLDCFELEPECEDWPRVLSRVARDEAESLDFAIKAVVLNEEYPRQSLLYIDFEMSLSAWSELAFEQSRLDACQIFAKALESRWLSFKGKIRKTERLLYHDISGRLALRDGNISLCEKHLFETLDHLDLRTSFQLVLVMELAQEQHYNLLVKFIEELDGKIVEQLGATTSKSQSIRILDMDMIAASREKLHKLLHKLKAQKPGSKKKIKAELQLAFDRN